LVPPPFIPSHGRGVFAGGVSKVLEIHSQTFVYKNQVTTVSENQFLSLCILYFGPLDLIRIVPCGMPLLCLVYGISIFLVDFLSHICIIKLR